ncbi:hypothetical protein L7F22_064371 [Adiantum nelumboides]|nr:hypothetical protein [Adiantum nelumboides]
METNFQVIERRLDNFHGSEFSCEHEDGQFERMSAQEHLESKNLIQEKIRKKKKKHKGSIQSPKQIMAFNTAKLLKLDEAKAEMRSKVLCKCPSFPATSTVKPVMENCGGSQHFSGCAITSSPHKKIAVLSRVASLPLKSAIRGSFEELGIGPRPKLHVHSDPSVWEPPSSTVSHTVIKNCRRKKGSKHGFFGDAEPCKAENGTSNSDFSLPRIVLGSRHKPLSQDGDKDVKTSMGNGSMLRSSFMMVENSELEAFDGSLVNREAPRDRTGEENDKKGASHYSHDSTCAGSFLVGSTVPCSFLYAEVL